MFLSEVRLDEEEDYTTYLRITLEQFICTCEGRYYKINYIMRNAQAH